jgi:hypothetical protein
VYAGSSCCQTVRASDLGRVGFAIMSLIPERLIASLADRYRIERALGASGA